MLLPHQTQECTGTWSRERHALRSYWRCDTCHALAEATLWMDKAAVRENLLGHQLHQLAKEGKKLLGGS